jgi:hypothetical protein
MEGSTTGESKGKLSKKLVMVAVELLLAKERVTLMLRKEGMESEGGTISASEPEARSSAREGTVEKKEALEEAAWASKACSLIFVVAAAAAGSAPAKKTRLVPGTSSTVSRTR